MVTADEIHKQQNKFLLHLSFYSFTELIDIKPFPGSLFIHSMSEPYSEEDIEAEVMQNWIRHFRLKFCQLHASGHASGREIMDIIREIRPQKAIPVHTEHPEIFKKLLKMKVIEPALARTIKFY
jgi:ribonuclease J